jgi:hypothetical protein
MMKTTPTPDVVDDEDEHYAGQAIELGNDKDDSRQANGRVRPGIKK